MNRSSGPGLIPRKVLFGNSERDFVKVSRDGTRIAFLAPLKGVMNVWAAPLDAMNEAGAVTNDAERGVSFYIWPYNPEYILHVQDTAGDENWHLYATHLSTLETKDLTSFEAIHARVLGLSPRHPDEILIEINDRDPRLHDIYRVNVVTGESLLILENDIDAAWFVADQDMNVRLAKVSMPDGGSQVLHREASGGWRKLMKVGPEDEITTHPIGLDSTGRSLYMIGSRNRDTAALVELDMDTLTERELAADSRADIAGFIVHPTTGRPQAVSIEHERARWETVDESLAEDIDLLQGEFKGDFWLTSRSLDDRYWVVAHDRDDGPLNFTCISETAKNSSCCSPADLSSNSTNWHQWNQRQSRRAMAWILLCT